MNGQYVDRCPICGGSAGRVIPAEGHHLCQALKRLGMSTPSLGENCGACGGSGVKRRQLPAGILLPTLPTGHEIKLWFPPCEACGGKGSVSAAAG
jgi:hypothetical protein